MPFRYGTSSCTPTRTPCAGGSRTTPFFGPSAFRLGYVDQYTEAFRTWLRDEAEVVDTADLTPSQAAVQIAGAVHS